MPQENQADNFIHKMLTRDQKLILFLAHLTMLSRHIENLFASLVDLDNSNLKNRNKHSYEIVYSGIMELLVVKYQSYWDEFDKHKGILPNTEKQRTMRKSLMEINLRWPDIKIYRNEIVAHGFRRGYESVFSLPLNTAYRIPMSYDHFSFIVDKLQLINKSLSDEYTNQIKAFSDDAFFKSLS